MIKTMAEVDIKEALRVVYRKIEEACEKRSVDLAKTKPTLVAVSKTKPVDLIVAAYEAGQRHFGENYVQELVDKANNSIILEKCTEIRWHFIGHLQSNKINKILSLPNIYMVQTVDSEKLATQLNKNWPKFGPPDSKLNVMVQVNTSNEEEKNGVDPSEVCDLSKYIIKECDSLNFKGLMTIGQLGYDSSQGPNPDFLSLVECRQKLSKELNLDCKTIELSMGMSNDYEQAIELGSTIVRVGSIIFGQRLPK